ncbi:M1 family metallopeptidase [Streptomyces sp. NPDC018029]|uniref:M1 family metallopeptidase n=1 Tax=Streptomyces sp. NPDC018029 TaxID=3365032 RepID=UPI0037A93998
MTDQTEFDRVLAEAARHAGSSLLAGSDLAGVGDPYFPVDGSDLFTLTHHALEVDFDVASGVLQGLARLEIAVSVDVPAIALDFGLPAREVVVDGSTVAPKALPGKLVVEPGTGFGAGRHHVEIAYAGSPGEVEIRGERSWLNTPLGALAAREPHAAAFWFPTNDHPSRKGTYDLTITVPRGFVAIAPGRLVEHSRTSQVDRFRWVTAEPVASYLYSLLIDRMRIELDTLDDGGLQWVSAYGDGVTEHAPMARASIETTPAVRAWLETLLGPYPFDAIGGVVTRMAGPHALETQTHPIYGDRFFGQSLDSYVVAHEMAHHWFGNSVSLSAWNDIWLSEGIATYLSWMWSEENDEGTTDELFGSFYQLRAADTDYWRVPPGDPSPAHLLSTQVYERGAMAAHVLRRSIGDDAFFNCLRTWCDAHRHHHGSLQQFLATVASAGGADVAALLRPWLFARRCPDPPPGVSARTHVEPPSLRFIRRTGDPQSQK